MKKGFELTRKLSPSEATSVWRYPFKSPGKRGPVRRGAVWLSFGVFCTSPSEPSKPGEIDLRLAGLYDLHYMLLTLASSSYLHHTYSFISVVVIMIRCSSAHVSRRLEIRVKALGTCRVAHAN
jgi:hypothetical protein